MFQKMYSRASQALLFASLLCAIFASLTFEVRAQVPNDPSAALTGIDVDVNRAMKELSVPGVAIGVIVDGKVVFAKGYGVRKLGSPELVDTQTLFAIGSMTKSFTAVTVAAMVDDGKLEWDKPVIYYLPWFKLYDPVATQLITPRDLLTHDSGLPRHDFIRISTYLSREELVRRLRYLEPSATFRQKFQYNNLTYVAAGYLAGTAAGETWEDLVKQRIFIPLKMKWSNTSAVELQQAENYAHPHQLIEGKVNVIPVYDYQKFGIGPNGAVNSCVDDMLRYLEFHLSDGTVEGTVIISKAQMHELHHPSIVTNSSSEGDEYALGWAVSHTGGEPVLEHGGEISGYTSEMMLLPNEKTGIVVLNNLASALPRTIAKDVLYRLLHLKPQDDLEQAVNAQKKYAAQAKAAKESLQAVRIPGTKPTLPLDLYAGSYFHPAYGAVRVERDGEGLVVHFDAIELHLHHYNYDTFSYESLVGLGQAQFHIGSTGKVAEMLLPLEPTVKPFVFTKKD